MLRGSNQGLTAAADRFDSLKRQAGEEGDTGHGLNMNLQDQYNDHDAEQQQASKRQRSMMQQQDFGMQHVVSNSNMNNGAINNSNNNNNGGDGPVHSNGNPMAGAPGNNNNNSNGNLNNPNNSNNAGAPGAGMNGSPMGMMNGMNPMAGMNGMAGMNPMAAMNGMGMNPMAAGMHMNGMPGGMNGMGGMNPMNGMPAMNGMGGMNPMNMAAARAGMFGGMPGPGGMGFNEDIAAALYLNPDAFQDPRTMGLLASQRAAAGAGLGFAGMPGGMGGMGGFFPGAMGGMGSFGGNPYAGLAGPGSPGAMGAGAAGMGLPGRRAQIQALMDMENNMQQQQQDQASKNASGSGPGLPGAGQGAAGGQGWGAQRPMGGQAAASGHGTQDSDGMALSATMQIPEPPMDIPTFSTATTPSVLPLPAVIEEGAAVHYSQRPHVPLGIDEDNNWLTEFQCFIRFDLIEVVQATRHVDQINAKNGGNNNNGGGETFQQVGVRCRYCAHLHPGQRASRSSAFPSSIRQLYQSFTMMLRDHFEQCSEIPPLRKKLFSELKAKNSQGAYDSKQYWIYAAEKLGMIDSDHGIQMTTESQAVARRKSPFGSVPPASTAAPPKLLVSPEDIRITSDFLYTLMSQVQVVHLIDSERVGKRKTLRVGLPGFGCRYCCHVGRCGLSRMFPLRRRMLPGKVNEIYEHVKRCTLFPTKEKELLARLRNEEKAGPDHEKEFFDRIWERLGLENGLKK
jgi:hypothetical protein